MMQEMQEVFIEIANMLRNPIIAMLPFLAMIPALFMSVVNAAGGSEREYLTEAPKPELIKEPLNKAEALLEAAKTVYAQKPTRETYCFISGQANALMEMGEISQDDWNEFLEEQAEKLKDRVKPEVRRKG